VKLRIRGSRYLFVLPCLAVLVGLVIYPLIYLINMSISVQDLTTGQLRFAGIVNYVRFFSDPRLLNAITVTVLYVVGVVISQLATGLVFGLLITSLSKYQKPVLIMCITPVLIAPILTGFMWSQLLDTTFGVINYALVEIGLLSSMSQIRWVTDPVLGVLTLLLVDGWQWTPFVGLICIAGLLSVPAELHEAADVDGLTRWQRFRNVTWPYLRPIMLVGLLFRAVDTARNLDLLYTLTRATPGGGTEALAYYIYRTGFEYFDMGYAAAMSWVLIAIVSVFTYLLVRTVEWAK